MASVLHKSKRGSWMHDDQLKDRFQGAYRSPPRSRFSLFNALRMAVARSSDRPPDR